MEQSSPPVTMASRSKTQWAKPEDWDKFRNTITALFMCHSLPVVMRIMREEHQFNATPKMFQSQIYQKWGLRKTKPGEAKREAKEARARKRLREDSDEAESVASSARSRGPGAAETLSVSGMSVGSTSPTGPAPWQADSEEANVASSSREKEKSRATPADAGGSHLTGDEGRSSTFVTAPDTATATTAPDAQAFVPKAWSDFLTQSLPASSMSGDDHIAATTAPPESSHAASDQVFSNDGSAPAVDEFGSWMSTVLRPNAPSSRGSPHQRGPPSAKSRSSHSSGRARTSHVSPNFEAGMSFSLEYNHAQAMAAIKKPLGSIRHIDSPQVFMVPEKTMFYARHYISNRFSTGLWALSQSTDTSFFDKECSKLERWYNDFNPGFDCLKSKKVKRAFRLLKRCFANTKTIIEPQDPRVIIYVVQQVIRAMWYDELGRNLSQTLLKYITGLCQVLFGVQHPLYIILDQLSRMDSFEFAYAIRPFMDCYFDHLEPFLEQSSNAFGHLTEMRGLTVSMMEATGMMGIYEAKPLLDSLVRKAESHGLPSLFLKVETAAVLHRNRFFSEALSLLSQVRDPNDSILYPYEFHYAGIVLILAHQGMKDREGTIRACYELLSYLARPLTTFSGYPDTLSMSLRQYIESRKSTLLLIQGKLEKELREAGRTEEADKIQARLDRGVIEEYGAEEPDGDPQADLNAMV
ncbi:hypothetical protein JX265_004805 [Neoarthrinium moseri]|uniref:Clr5 domain-containing protein n=1 Tax=Neoarthrinium moseri TaxID=1658444 RepID=A0A9Q0AND7_9PEZI|nr:hypothetical protein JX265_004805 [Neoarthrinium moseri]